MKKINLFLIVLFFIGINQEFAQSIKPNADTVTVFLDRLREGFNMGLNTSGGSTNWGKVENGEICMSYPGHVWGVLFITVGDPKELPRPSMDFSEYRRLVVELKGSSGDTVLVGLKDKYDPDNGSETKVRVGLSDNWEEHEFLLPNFITADLTRLYVVTEFAFETVPVSVCVKKIQFINR